MTEQPNTASEIMQIDYAAIREQREQDNMFRQIADAAVHAAMSDARVDGIEEGNIRTKDVANIALAAVSHALKIAFEKDAALSMAIAERDHYKKVALGGLSFLTPQSFIVKETP